MRKTCGFSPRYSLALVGIKISEGNTNTYHVPQEFLKGDYLCLSPWSS